jgi:hypothetical protein
MFLSLCLEKNVSQKKMAGKWLKMKAQSHRKKKKKERKKEKEKATQDHCSLVTQTSSVSSVTLLLIVSLMIVNFVKDITFFFSNLNIISSSEKLHYVTTIETFYIEH